MKGWVGAYFTGVDFIALGVIFLECLRRLSNRDSTIRKSPLSVPLIALLITMGAYPMIHMFIVENGLRIPLEICIVPMLIAYFFVYLFLFRKQELRVMIWMVMIGAVYKSIEIFLSWIKGTNSWSLSCGWRDALLFSMMLLACVAAVAVKPGADAGYARIRKFIFYTFPIVAPAFIFSLRRSYMIGVIIIIPIMYIVMRKSERKSYKMVLGAGLTMIVLSVMAMGPDVFFTRMAGISNPDKEESAAYRVFEAYNTWNMVALRPIFGWPYAVPIRNFTNVNLDIVSTISPHNVYLYLMLRGGIFALAAWLWFIWRMIVMSRRSLKAARTPFERFSTIWLFCLAPMLIFTGFTTPVVTDNMQETLPFFLVMFSYLPGVWQPTKKAISGISRGRLFNLASEH